MNLKQIVEQIDLSLKNSFQINTLHPLKAFGLAEFYYEGENFYPGILDGTEIKNCFLDDEYNLSWYHRNSTGDYNVVPNNYGNTNDKTEEINTIELVIYANRTKIKFSLETLKDLFVTAIPSVLSKSVCESIDLLDCNIELVSHQMDSNKNFKEEVSTKYVRVGVEHGLIKIRYQIKSTYRRGCLVLCVCENN